MVSRRALIRADATRNGGIGHLVRSLAIAEAAMGRGWAVKLVGNIETDLARALCADAGLETVEAVGAESLSWLALEHDASIVHVDSYDAVAPRDELNKCGVLLSSIEDGVFGRREADFVIDSNPWWYKHERPFDGSNRFLFGPKFAPLRKELRAHRRSKGRDRERQRPVVLVMMGGSDAFGVSAKVAALCLQEGWDVKVLIEGARWRRMQGVSELDSVEQIEPGVDGLLEVAKADAVISGAGTTLWELACLGVPAGLVELTKNQSQNYAFAVSAGIAVGIGDLTQIRNWDSRSRAAVKSLLGSHSLRVALGRAGPNLVDGRGAPRIVAEWDSRLEPGGVTVRKAELADASRLLAWRNDETVRAASRDGHELGWPEHLRWLEAVLSDDKRLLLIVEQGNVAVATVRFDAVASEFVTFEVSIAVAPQLRGAGIGPQALASAEQWLLENVPGPLSVMAVTKSGNSASIRLFRRAGYEPFEHATEGFSHMVKKLD